MDFMAMIKQEKRELAVVIILILLCLFSALIGFISINKKINLSRLANFSI